MHRRAYSIGGCLFGTADRFYVLFGLSYTGQLWVYRVLVWALPAAVLVATHRVCVELRRGKEVEARRQAAEKTAGAV